MFSKIFSTTQINAENKQLHLMYFQLKILLLEKYFTPKQTQPYTHMICGLKIFMWVALDWRGGSHIC
jgi:hypothetical protein